MDTVWNFFIIDMTGVIMPGPVFALLFSNVLKQESNSAYYTILAVMIVSAIYATTSLFLFDIVSHNIPMVQFWISILGSLYLCYLGIINIFFYRAKKINKNKITVSRQQAFWEGFTYQALNANAIVGYFAILPSIVAYTEPIWVKTSVVFITFFDGLIGLSVVVYLISLKKINTYITLANRYLIPLTGIVLFTIGSRILWSVLIK